MRDELISDAYLREQQLLHAAPRGYGGRGSKWSPVVEELLRRHSCRSMLDYGCGQGSLVRVLSNNFKLADGLELREYDPAIAGKDATPAEPADLVVCTDVLEHIESDKIARVLRHLSELTGHALFTVISLVPTNKTLSDGRQAHILLRSVEWWKYQFQTHGLVLSQTVKGRDPKKDHKQFAAVWVRCGS
jgi:2-polyprenyl-3-methyl-5-hydroxy-6-metoxy-1,4-benzoquinol methylase